MDATNRFAIPFPEDTDPPDGPAQLQALAEAAEVRAAYAGAQGGKSIIPTEQARTNTAFGELGTPDRVSDLVLPTDGLIFVLFHGLFKSSVAQAGRAALFLDSQQIKAGGAGAAPLVIEAQTFNGADTYSELGSSPAGLAANRSGATSSVVTTGQVMGTLGPGEAITAGGSAEAHFGLCVLFAAADTYDVSVRFKASSGSVTAKERKLYAWTKEFPTSGV